MKLRLTHIDFDPKTSHHVTAQLDWICEQGWEQELTSYIRLIGEHSMHSPKIERNNLIQGIQSRHIGAAVNNLINDVPIFPDTVVLMRNEKG